MNFKRFLAILLAVVMCVSLAACTSGTEQSSESGSESASASGSESAAGGESTPLVVSSGAFSEKFSPFFSDTVYDQWIWTMTSVGSILTTDRSGGIVYNAIEGETHSYNGTDYLYTGPADVSVAQNDDGTTTYTMKIRDDIKFSDGQVADADDIIFTLYVFLDPSYVGSTTLNSYDIVGLRDYQTQTTSDIYEKYSKFAADILAAGPDHVWSAADGWTQEMQTWFWENMTTEWKADLQSVVDYVMNNYLADYASTIGKTADEISASDGLKIAFAAAMWNWATVNEDGSITLGDKTFKLTDTDVPTMDDLYAAVSAIYKGDAAAYWSTENNGTCDSTDVAGTVSSKFITEFGAKDENYQGSIPNISGIKKVDQQTVTVTTNGYEAPAIYSICGIPLVPMHYYGDEAKYDYDNNMFGHDFGDLSKVESVTTTPMGAGPYKFIEYKDKVVYFEANENYYKGAPKIQYLQYKETADADGIPGVASGVIDVANPSGSKAKFEEIRGYNSNGELDGDKITTSSVDNLGYGYIGINADTVRVGTDSSSEQSKDLRKAFATMFSVYRDVAIDSYYGDAATVINYPISNTSWAAPKPSDPDYKIAYSTDVDGKDIYTSEMTQDEKYAAALQAALGYFEAAGYTVTDGKLTAAPEGAKLSYEIMIPGDGIGDHPAFGILSSTSEALATIGMELKVNDLTDSSLLWDALDAGSQEMWTAAWQAVIDPDMYQVYHSSGIIGRGGSDSNHYHIDDPELDQLIVDARASDDQEYRKATYKSCLDIILDWACEIPTYQRQNIIIFSTERINIDTLTPDITTYWDWSAEIEKLEMK